MTATCIDSSALLRAVFGEGDLQLVVRALSSKPTVAGVALVEVPCAVEARVLRGEFPTAARQAARDYADQLLGPLAVVDLDETVRTTAIEIAERHLLRSLDLIHVATAAVVARRQADEVVRFCTADRRQAEVAEALLGAGRVDFVPPWR